MESSSGPFIGNTKNIKHNKTPNYFKNLNLSFFPRFSKPSNQNDFSNRGYDNGINNESSTLTINELRKSSIEMLKFNYSTFKNNNENRVPNLFQIPKSRSEKENIPKSNLFGDKKPLPFKDLLKAFKKRNPVDGRTYNNDVLEKLPSKTSDNVTTTDISFKSTKEVNKKYINHSNYDIADSLGKTCKQNIPNFVHSIEAQSDIQEKMFTQERVKLDNTNENMNIVESETFDKMNVSPNISFSNFQFKRALERKKLLVEDEKLTITDLEARKLREIEEKERKIKEKEKLDSQRLEIERQKEEERRLFEQQRKEELERRKAEESMKHETLIAQKEEEERKKREEELRKQEEETKKRDQELRKQKEEEELRKQEEERKQREKEEELKKQEEERRRREEELRKQKEEEERRKREEELRKQKEEEERRKREEELKKQKEDEREELIIKQKEEELIRQQKEMDEEGQHDEFKEQTEESKIEALKKQIVEGRKESNEEGMKEISSLNPLQDWMQSDKEICKSEMNESDEELIIKGTLIEKQINEMNNIVTHSHTENINEHLITESDYDNNIIVKENVESFQSCNIESQNLLIYENDNDLQKNDLCITINEERMENEVDVEKSNTQNIKSLNQVMPPQEVIENTEKLEKTKSILHNQNKIELENDISKPTKLEEKINSSIGDEESAISSMDIQSIRELNNVQTHQTINNSQISPDNHLKNNIKPSSNINVLDFSSIPEIEIDQLELDRFDNPSSEYKKEPQKDDIGILNKDNTSDDSLININLIPSNNNSLLSTVRINSIDNKDQTSSMIVESIHNDKSITDIQTNTNQLNSKDNHLTEELYTHSEKSNFTSLNIENLKILSKDRSKLHSVVNKWLNNGCKVNFSSVPMEILFLLICLGCSPILDVKSKELIDETFEGIVPKKKRNPQYKQNCESHKKAKYEE